MNKIDASVKLMKCLIYSFTKTLFRYCFRVTNSVFDRLYNDSYDDSIVISIAWSWSLCKSNLSALSVKNTSSYSFNSMSKDCVSDAFMIQLNALFIASTWCSMINSSTTLIIMKAYTVNSFCKAFAKSFVMNNLNAWLFVLKHHVLAIMFIQIRLNCILDIFRIKKDSFLLIA